MNSTFQKNIGIHGVPRSGTSWLAQIFNSHPDVKLKFQPLFSYALKNAINEHSSINEILDFYTKMWSNEEDLFLNMKDPVIHRNYPKFQKSNNPKYLIFKQVHHHYVIENLLNKDKNIKFILIIRNPLAVLNSWKNAPKEFNTTWNFNEEWRYAKKKNANLKENYFGFEKWKETTLMFLKLKEKFKDKIYILSYNKLISDTPKEVELLFNFAGIGELDNQTKDFIRNSKSIHHSDHNSVFKANANDNQWKNNLPENVVHQVTEEVKKIGLTGFLNMDGKSE